MNNYNTKNRRIQTDELTNYLNTKYYGFSLYSKSEIELRIFRFFQLLHY
jgi:hypothetical protein